MWGYSLRSRYVQIVGIQMKATVIHTVKCVGPINDLIGFEVLQNWRGQSSFSSIETTVKLEPLVRGVQSAKRVPNTFV